VFKEKLVIVRTPYDDAPFTHPYRYILVGESLSNYYETYTGTTADALRNGMSMIYAYYDGEWSTGGGTYLEFSSISGINNIFMYIEDNNPYFYGPVKTSAIGPIDYANGYIYAEKFPNA
ncbi:hypothetical protein M0Q97_10255, partial [Candidatus Dojkabacteria bacterium]|nr:hypothetical protein [Candidatus Dojkabacteria bacterium]